MRSLFFLSFLVFFIAKPTHAKMLGIYPVASLKAAKKQIDQHVKDPSKTLLAVDIDLTLTAPNHPALDLPNYKKNKGIFDEIFKNQPPLFIEKAFTHALMIAGQHLIDPNAPKILKDYKNQGVKVIAFTASIVGPLPPISAVESMRHQILQSLGLDFSDSFLQQIVLLRSIQPYNNQLPTYYRGILFANGGRAPHTKGDVIRQFLRLVRFHPKLVIIIDDRLKNIEEIASALEFHDPDIDVLGLEFTAMHDHSEKALTPQEFRSFWETIKAQVG